MSAPSSRQTKSALNKVQKKPSPRRKTTPKKKERKSLYKILFGFVAIVVLSGTIYHYRFGLARYFSFVTKHPEKSNKEIVEEARIYQVLKAHPKKVFGIDVSEYQGKIDWDLVKTVEDSFPVSFVFIRATAGKDKVDARFAENWKNAHNKLIRGAYHYYRPNENSIQQADLFIQNVKLAPGDLPPVLDIENLPKTQSIESLKLGLRRWLNKIEQHYKVRPIIYSGERYYKDFLKKDFPEYTVWIANYNFWVESIPPDWLFWQFSEKSRVNGIQGNVDVNIYNGTPKMLQYLTIK
jgi:lysozyme